MNIETNPPTRIGSRDFARLEQVIEQPAWREQPAAIALAQELERAEVLEPEAMPPDVVTMNSIVQCIDEDRDLPREITLCYPHDAEVSQDRVSVLAPLGTALLGLSVGQRIEWTRPGVGPLRLRVTGLRYQPEAAGEYMR